MSKFIQCCALTNITGNDTIILNNFNVVKCFYNQIEKGKNMKKKVNNILKGVAGVGVALGGANAFSENDVLFATELDQVDEELEELEEQIESGSESGAASESLVESLSESNMESASLSDSKVDSVSKSQSIVASESASQTIQVSMANSTSESAYLSTSESAYNSAESVYGSEVANILLSPEYQTNGNSISVAENGDILQVSADGTYTYWYNSGQSKLELNPMNVTFDEDGNPTVNFDGFYLKGDGTIGTASAATDPNERSGNKVFINGEYVVEDDGYWKAVVVDLGNGNTSTVKYVDQKEAHGFSTYRMINIGGTNYFLDGAEYSSGKLKVYTEVNLWGTKKNPKTFENVTLSETTKYKKKEDVSLTKQDTATSQSQYESASVSASTSASIANSQSNSSITSANQSTSAASNQSDSTSTSASESTSEAKSQSESSSESLSQLVSTSVSNSESLSESTSVSTSLSNSNSASVSTSLSNSESVSLSTSVSNSESTSLSTSVSNSNSASLSTSVSNSESASVST